ncbi:aminodeoxychorismate/anthranilate synthase component II [Flavobacterium filum]|uniref:anthranilate synthase component II n=1 Tax=Flavobacterium TaxID=237 RepID=UPI000429E124|nr:aminodeoxychorismate/anthranilate synthase component II [Flavobacterium filum]
MKKVVIIDNYDSFTYNLVHYLEDLNCQVTVYRNDEFELDELEKFDKILLSPGPGLPSEAGLLKEVIQHYAPSKSILGICLGLQAIAEVFGGNLLNLNKVHHGKSSEITLVSEDSLFNGLPKNILVGRYHSWVMNPDAVPEVLEVTSIDEEQQIMSIKHNNLDVKGVQFHPESILTPDGKTILKNWVELTSSYK